MLRLARLIPCLLALLFLTAMASADVAPSDSARSLSLQSAASSASLEDGPEGEEAPLTTFVRFYDGDDQIGARAFDVAFPPARSVLVALDLGRDPPGPSHSPCAGYPTGPPRA